MLTPPGVTRMDVFAALLDARPPQSGLRICPPFGGRAIGPRDQFHQMTVRIVEIDAATIVKMIDLTAPGAVEVGVECDARTFDARERGVEFLLADEDA